MLSGNNNIIYNISIFLLVLLFIYAGLSKLLSHEIFLNQISKAAWLKKIAGLISILLPLLEIGTGLLIAASSIQIYGLWLASLLMTTFTIYVSMMLLSGNSLPCTCGGVIASMSWKQHLLFNIFFMCLSWFALYNHYKERNEIISTNKKEVSRKPLRE